MCFHRGKVPHFPIFSYLFPVRGKRGATASVEADLLCGRVKFSNKLHS